MQIFANKVFENPVETIIAFDNDSFIKAFLRMEELRNTHYLLGYIRYEAKEIFLGKSIKTDKPLLFFEVYKEPKKQEDKDVEKNYASMRPCIYASPVIDFENYSNAINQIKDEIANGNTYQVNYTYDYKLKTNLNGLDLYKSVLKEQTTPYNAFIKNDYGEIMSFSPELFFELEGNNIKTKPMKGTVKRGENEQEDIKNVEFLKNDIKNRAENVMIVDLLRNDLGKIAKTGTVNVDKLFEVETHNTVHQMTSEVTAELEEGTTLFDIFNAIYPCGSVTGAPKINTMEIIDRLEVGERNVYCGAIGLISPEKTVFSVPIRILQGWSGFYRCRVGGAIVWDSTAEDEWEETLTKIKFLGLKGKAEQVIENIELPNDIKLVETMLAKGGEIEYMEEHMQRMKKSAECFGFKFDEQNVKCKVQNVGRNCYSAAILRFLLNKDGTFETQILPACEIRSSRVVISETTVDSNEIMLYYKTTHRPWYQQSMEKIKSGEIFDEIFFNEKGELTEGSRSNIVVQFGDELFTPPIKCGLLNGVLRQKLLDEGKIKEKILKRNDLEKADKIFCINSVRDMVEVQVSVEVGV